MKYEFYQIERGRIHIKAKDNSLYDPKFICGQVKLVDDKKVNIKPSIVCLSRELICKRCYNKFSKLYNIVELFPEKLFEI